MRAISPVVRTWLSAPLILISSMAAGFDSESSFWGSRRATPRTLVGEPLMPEGFAAGFLR